MPSTMHANSTTGRSANAPLESRMCLSDLFYLIGWDLRVNRGWSLDHFRAKLLLVEVRLEQYLYHRLNLSTAVGRALWGICRFLGSIYQWLLCNSNIPGSVTIGRGLRLPHPQNLVIAYHADIGEFCTIYHDVSIVWNGFIKATPGRPQIGTRVLIGTKALIIGDVTIGDDVLIGAGAIVPKSIPSGSRAVNSPAQVTPRPPSDQRPEAGSEEHLSRGPYSIWR